MFLPQHALRAAAAAAVIALALPFAAQAQNIAIVNGKAVPKARVDSLINQAKKANPSQPLPPEMEQRAKDEVVLREIFAQEAERQGVSGTPEFRQQLELLRQTILIRELFEQYKKKHPVTDAEAKAEYDKIKSASPRAEYRARHILVEKEDEAKDLIKQIKGGAKFEDLAKKHSKDPGSGENGGDLDFAKPDAYVPEFSQAMTQLKKGEMTETPVKSQFGFHIIRLDDVREAQFPEFDAVKDRIKQNLEQTKVQKYQEDLRKSAKTDYKFPQ
jgi:peptidyl-prolyl cis-trans isomerase C